MEINELDLYKCALAMVINDIAAEQAQAQDLDTDQRDAFYQETMANYLDIAHDWLQAPHHELVQHLNNY
ncbi:hypothetical protein [Pseudanabaena sp. PCC 6802]|uniref:hypothetical protein n=1 Tax=Pseudanabaena sp. PCC 6802 TaxID=118173 RepID=UPI0003481629|nr:hypothetical protein [Pseudanabaena sp. PCC 6802]